MLFTANTINPHRFYVVNRQDEMIGTLDIDLWTTSFATIAINDRIYTIEKPDFWRSTKTVRVDNELYLTIKPHVGSDLKLNFFKTGRALTFMRQSIWDSNSGHMLRDEQDQQIATIEAGFRWGFPTGAYTIDIDTDELDNEAATFLPILMVYCVQLLKRG